MFDIVSDALKRKPVDPAAWIESLAGFDGHDLTDSERIDQISDLERLKAAAAAAQARITEAFYTSQGHSAPTLKPTGEVVRSITAQVALARRESPARGQQHVGVALGLVNTATDARGTDARQDLGVAGHPDYPRDSDFDP